MNAVPARFPKLRAAALAIMAMIAATSSHANAQDASATSGNGAIPANTTDLIVDRVALEPLDQRVSDLNPLGNSLRITEAGLGIPNDFRQVFRVPGDRNMMMRAQGGLYAVFPQSTYGEWEVKKTKERFHIPVIGQGTVFYIGAEALRQAFAPPRSRDGDDDDDAHRSEASVLARPETLYTGVPMQTRVNDAMPADRMNRQGMMMDDDHDQEVPSRANKPRRSDQAQSRVDRATSTTTTTTTLETELTAAESAQLPTIIADEDYRRSRVGALLRKARGGGEPPIEQHN